MCKNCTYDSTAKEASEFTKSYLKQISDNEQYMSHGSQENAAEQGFLEKGTPNLGNTFPFENYEDFIKTDELCPESVHPALWEHAKLNMKAGIFRIFGEGSEELKKGDVFQVRGYDLSNMTVVRGDSGWIILDILTTTETAKNAFDNFKKCIDSRFVKDSPIDHSIKGVIYSHSHVDHYGGVSGLVSEDSVLKGSEDNEKIKILAPEGFLKYAVSENVYAGNAMSTRAVFMYGSRLEKSSKGQVDAGLGKVSPVGTNSLIAPTEEIGFSQYEDANKYVIKSIDGVAFYLQLTPGTEAPAEMNVYMPETNVLFIAENCTGTLHNLYTLRGAEVRDGMAWADYLDETIVTFSEVETICSSHNWPHFGKEECIKYLELQRDAYRYINNTTLNLINRGYTIDEVGRKLEQNVPDEIRNEWCNHGFYGTFNHNAKAVYQRYIGWYDGNPSNLNRILPTEAATKYVECMGGMDQVLRYAERAFKKGEYAWVAELLNRAIFADVREVDSKTLEKIKLLNADALEQLGYQSESGPWRNEYLTAAFMLRAKEIQAGSSNVKSTVSEDTIKAMPMPMIIQYMGILFKGMDASKNKFEKGFHLTFTDTKENGYIWSKRGVLNYRDTNPNIPGILMDEVQNLSKLEFYQKITGEKDSLKIGNKVLDCWLPYLDQFTPGFNVVTPKVFGQTSPMIPQDIRQQIFDCAMMFEKYEYQMISFGGDSCKAFVLSEQSPGDSALWLNTYRIPLTVNPVFEFEGEKGPYLEDYSFFDEDNENEDNENMGIGVDAIFCKNEYAHFMYECYKKLALDAPLVPSIIRDCIEMLEPYVEKFRGRDPNKNPSDSFQLNKDDLIMWTKIYHPLLVQTNIILDDKFFDPTGKNPHWGIGTDGIFVLSELCNVLARCYKLLLVNEFKQLINN